MSAGQSWLGSMQWHEVVPTYDKLWKAWMSTALCDRPLQLLPTGSINVQVAAGRPLEKWQLEAAQGVRAPQLLQS